LKFATAAATGHWANFKFTTLGMKRHRPDVSSIDEGKPLDAFERDIVDLLPRLRRFARSLTGHAADADDLAQLTVERAFVQRRRWRPGTRLDSWMFTIMKHAWIDETRARHRAGRVFENDERALEVADAAVPAMEVRLEALEVERALEQLPADQRIAVALVLIEGLSYREAADVLEVPMGTLTSRLGRGRMALLALLGEEV
jgi:RNA polymerase sigma-70 factor (ECF subfamily)